MSSDEICKECNQKYTNTYWEWCKPCNSKHFRNDFNNWTSGNDKIDKFIQDSQLNANDDYQVIEWIPYDRFEDVKQIGKGGFGTIHYARWIDGEIWKWDIENQQWERYDNREVALKKFDNFVNFNDILNEMEIHLKTYTDSDVAASIRFYGITQDPETHSYMMVLEYAADGNLREYLKINFNNINWEQKLLNLRKLSSRLMNIHKLDIVHQDFHPGNILSYDFKGFMYISDFGLSKLIGADQNHPEKKNVVGVLPYIAPEVLSGDEEYTKAADVYSFGIIAYEMITGFPPYPDIPHDEDLAIKICNGLRPKIPFHTPKLITRTIMRCWDARVTHRPTFEELHDELEKYYIDYENYLWERKNKNSEIVIQIKKAEEFSANQDSTNTTTNSTTTTPLNYQTHPQAIYTSRLLNYSRLPKPKNKENFERELEELTKSFSHITTNIVHQDFHPGNILSYDFKGFMYISDFGLSKLIGADQNHPEKKNVVGVLPYIAPEVLSGDEEYTKAADVYSFGIIAYEMITGFPPYPDIPHDEDLAIKICNGLRPKIPFHTPKLITRTIMRCWDARVTHRPTFEELHDELEKYYIDYENYLWERKNKNSEIVIQIKKAEEFSANQDSTNTTTNSTTTTPLNYQTHPQAIYTSRLLNYSRLPKPKNKENFERELEELTKSFSHITTNDDIDEF
ncbi:hypothetical protein Glove_21g205 [Diversispora epigaea]|uniref:Protein kinase domain-containing protein n=1 Tax=Diversispora epigaea TaxID=1348612 RepID=A0A397JV76_9GLOM|nr:hypothetical protein Glove_21g205 [Diversispora epigaea]